MRFPAPFVLSLLLLLTACAQRQGEDVVKRGEVGVSRAVEFGTIIGMHEVTIMADDAAVGGGMLLGAGAGAGGGSYVGDGSGSTWATAGGAVAGALIGDMLATELGKSEGMEYLVQLRNGEVKTIVQDIPKDGESLKVGDKVMLQYCDANKHNYRCKPEKRTERDFQRLYKVDRFPVETKKKRKK